MTINKEMRVADLQLGDIIRIGTGDAPFNDAIVSHVGTEAIKLFRPYGTNADFSCTSGVICYVGIEEYSIPRDARPVFVYRRQVLK